MLHFILATTDGRSIPLSQPALSRAAGAAGDEPTQCQQSPTPPGEARQDPRDAQPPWQTDRARATSLHPKGLTLPFLLSPAWPTVNSTGTQALLGLPPPSPLLPHAQDSGLAWSHTAHTHSATGGHPPGTVPLATPHVRLGPGICSTQDVPEPFVVKANHHHSPLSQWSQEAAGPSGFPLGHVSQPRPRSHSAGPTDTVIWVPVPPFSRTTLSQLSSLRRAVIPGSPADLQITLCRAL